VDEGKIESPIPWICDACFAEVVEIGCGKFGERKSMKANQLATLVLRLLGIYCLIQVIPAVSITSSAAPLLFSADGLNYSAFLATMAVILFLALQLAIGILLIVKSVPWGEKLIPQTTDTARITTVSFEQVQVLAFAIAGVLVFSETVPQLMNSFVSIFTSLSAIARGTRYPIDNFYVWRSFFIAIGTLAKAGLGLWLFFGARGFANFWRSMRNFGTPKPPVT
jgi:hypothetical protein